MNQNTFFVSIPPELKSFEKTGKSSNFSINCSITQNFGVKVFKKNNGEVNYTAFYSDDGELLKKCHYKGVYIKKIEYFRSDKIFCTEDYEEEKLIKKTYYDKSAKFKSEISYQYERNNIVSVKKLQNRTEYKVIYGYDELGRINKRTFKVNNETINEQKYRFDILDRIVEFSDSNQKIQVLQISPENRLIYYKITDRIGNEISVINTFGPLGYKYTELSLNGHKISISDNSYVDNIMLKKPYATEDDLDLIISNLLNDNSKEDCATKRSGVMDMAGHIIQNNIQSRALPISLRKRILYNMSLNAS